MENELTQPYPAKNMELILKEKYTALSMVDNNNDVLNSKAAGLLQASGIVLALIGLISVQDLVSGNPDLLKVITVVVSTLAFIIMLGLLLTILQPTYDYHIPGTQEWDRLYDKYISVSENECFHKILVNTIETIEQIVEINKAMSYRLWCAGWLFFIQIVGFLVVVGISIFS